MDPGGEAHTRQRYIDTLGNEFGDYFFHLDQSVIDLVLQWDVYRALFGTNKERVDLLNHASGYVTRIIQDSLQDRVVLGICQVSDPYQSVRGRRNITVCGLYEHISDPLHRAALDPMLDAVKSSVSFARDLRNKMIAHSDLEAATGGYAVDYSSRERIVIAIRSIIVPLRYVHHHYLGATQGYHAVKPLPDAVGFLKCIYRGVAKLEEEFGAGFWLEREHDGLPVWLTEPDRNEFDSEIYTLRKSP